MRRASRLVQDSTIQEGPAKDANGIHKLTFWDAIKIFKIGLKRDFQDADLTHPLEAHKSAALDDKSARLWSKEVVLVIPDDRKSSLVKVIVKCFGWEVCKYGFLLLIMELGFRLFQPLFIGLLVTYFSETNKHNTTDRYPSRMHHYFTKNQSKILYSEAIGGVFCNLSSLVVIHPVFALLILLGMKKRIAVNSLIHRKALRQCMTELGGSTVGNVVDLLSNNVNRFNAASPIRHYSWIGRATLLISIYFIYQEIDNAAFIEAIPVLFVIPLHCVLGFFTAKLRLKTAARADNRVS